MTHNHTFPEQQKTCKSRLYSKWFDLHVTLPTFYISITSEEHDKSCNLIGPNLFEKLLTIAISSFSIFDVYIIIYFFSNYNHFHLEFPQFYPHIAKTLLLFINNFQKMPKI